MGKVLPGLLMLSILGLGACSSLHQDRKSPEQFRNSVSRYSSSPFMHKNSAVIPRPFDAVYADVKPRAEKCLNKVTAGVMAWGHSSTRESVGVVQTGPQTAELTYWHNGLIFAQIDFVGQGPSSTLMTTYRNNVSYVEKDVRGWASGEKDGCSLFRSPF